MLAEPVETPDRGAGLGGVRFDALGSEQGGLRRRDETDVDLVGLDMRLAPTRHRPVEEYGEVPRAEDALDYAVAGDAA